MLPEMEVKIKIWEGHYYQEAGKSAWGCAVELARMFKVLLGGLIREQASPSPIRPLEPAAQAVIGINPKSARLL